MVEFIMQKATTFKLSTHQTIRKNCEVKKFEQVQVTSFSGCVARKYGVSAPFCLSGFVLSSLNWPGELPIDRRAIRPVQYTRQNSSGRPGRFTRRPIY